VWLSWMRKGYALCWGASCAAVASPQLRMTFEPLAGLSQG
jgi:hypothetical protein